MSSTKCLRAGAGGVDDAACLFASSGVEPMVGAAVSVAAVDALASNGAPAAIGALAAIGVPAGAEPFDGRIATPGVT